jgi:hypothetical protein
LRPKLPESGVKSLGFTGVVSGVAMLNIVKKEKERKNGGGWNKTLGLRDFFMNA